MSNLRPLARLCSLECLEARHALAGEVAAFMNGEMLVIWGNEQSNGVVLTYSSATLSYTVTGQDAGGSPTTINGGAAASFSGVQSVAVLTNGGDDAFSVGSPAAVDTVIERWLSIDMGDGNDELQLGRGGNPPGGSDPVALRLRTGTSVNVLLGAGDDHLEIANADIGLALNVVAGDGNDEIDFATQFNTSETEFQLFPVIVRNNSYFNLGGGEDHLKICHTIFQGQLVIQYGAGIAHLDLYNLNIAKKLDIDTGNEDDQIKIDFVQARDLTIDSNNGVDDIDITNSRFRSMILKLGAQRDALLIRNARVTFLTRLDGGANGSRLAGSNNVLRGLLKRNMG